jgi:hypothetical protein
MTDSNNYHDVWKLARMAGYNLVISTDSFYAVCDGDFKTLVKCNSLKGVVWYINNMQYLTFSQTA